MFGAKFGPGVGGAQFGAKGVALSGAGMPQVRATAPTPTFGASPGLTPQAAGRAAGSASGAQGGGMQTAQDIARGANVAEKIKSGYDTITNPDAMGLDGPYPSKMGQTVPGTGSIPGLEAQSFQSQGLTPQAAGSGTPQSGGITYGDALAKAGGAYQIGSSLEGGIDSASEAMSTLSGALKFTPAAPLSFGLDALNMAGFFNGFKGEDDVSASMQYAPKASESFLKPGNDIPFSGDQGQMKDLLSRYEKHGIPVEEYQVENTWSGGPNKGQTYTETRYRIPEDAKLPESVQNMSDAELYRELRGGLGGWEKETARQLGLEGGSAGEYGLRFSGTDLGNEQAVYDPLNDYYGQKISEFSEKSGIDPNVWLNEEAWEDQDAWRDTTGRYWHKGRQKLDGGTGISDITKNFDQTLYNRFGQTWQEQAGDDVNVKDLWFSSGPGVGGRGAQQASAQSGIGGVESVGSVGQVKI